MKALFVLLLACAIFGSAGYYTYELFIRPGVELQKEKDAPATPVPPDPAEPELAKCIEIKKQLKWLDARKAFEEFIEQHPESRLVEKAKDELGEVNSTIFLTPIPAPEKQVYVVKSGDVLNAVARKTKSTVELIMRANNLSGTMLRIGQKLYLPPADFSVVISRKHQRVTILNGGKFFKHYPIKDMPAAIQPKKGVPAVKQAGKVIERIAWLDGSRVTLADKGYADASHWITISIGHCTLYAQPPEGADPKTYQKPPSGIALDAGATAELSAMLSRGNPVTLE